MSAHTIYARTMLETDLDTMLYASSLRGIRNEIERCLAEQHEFAAKLLADYATIRKDSLSTFLGRLWPGKTDRLPLRVGSIETEEPIQFIAALRPATLPRRTNYCQ
jgi:hypothetical protein